MAQKLIDGNITIEDKASKSLSAIEKALRNIEKVAKPVTKQMKELNNEISKMKSAKIDAGKLYTTTQENMRKVSGFKSLPKQRQFSAVDRAVGMQYRQVTAETNLAAKSVLADLEIKKINAKSSARRALSDFEMQKINAKAAAKEKYFDRLDSSISLRGLNRQASITQQELLRSMRQDKLMEHQKALVGMNEEVMKRMIAEREASMKRVAEYKKELALKSQQEKMEQRLAAQEQRLSQSAQNRTDWQKKMDKLAAKGGMLQPMWESLGKSESAVGVARSPHLLSEGAMGVFGKMGKFGKGVSGFVGGRVIGGMMGSAGLGGIVGGALAGPIGIAIAALGTLLIGGISKLISVTKEISGILNEISTERAAESTSLRVKMQMSSEMFGVDPRNVEGIDKKIYGLRTMEQEYYKHGMAGRDITTSAIDWLHLLGTKDSGGVFKDEKQAFDFSAALSAISKMNGLSAQEYETVRYQGMQILSKGYADILDVKPLLNSAPGFVRDLLQQTGMSRKELLESGRTKSFTSDKFIDALMGVKDYYEVLSDRASSRTAAQQEEASKNIIGAAAVWDEQYNKAKAESNTMVTNAVIQGGLAGHIRESWYKMWSDTNDAQDGINQKVQFEKELTYGIWTFLNDAYTVFVVIKNIFDLIVDAVMFIGKEIYAVIRGAYDAIVNGLSSLVAFILRGVAKIPGVDSENLNLMANAYDPNSERNLKERAYQDAAERMADAIIKNDLAGGRERIAKELPEIFNEKYVSGEKVSYETVPGKLTVTTVPLDVAKNPSVNDAIRGYKIIEQNDPNYTSGVKVERTIDDWTNTTKKEVRTPIYESKLNEDKLARIVYSGLNSDDKTSKAADRSAMIANIKKELESGGIKLNDDVVEKFGLRGDESAYSWQNIALSRPGQYLKEFGEDVKQDIDDIDNVMKKREETNELAKQAFENMKAPYLPKISQNTDDIKAAQGKGNGQILDVLKEIAGITVINKVTRVRPDVVFNFGSYGRNGKNEDPNLRAVGDKLNSFYNEEENKVSINGIPVLNEP